MRVEREKSPEQMLWQAVVLRAFLDATGTKKRLREVADSCIRSSGYFKVVVNRAGMDPDFLRDAYVAKRVDPKLLRNATQEAKK